MQSNDEKTKKKRIKDANFLIGVAMGLTIGLLIELILEFFSPIPKWAIFIMAVICVFAGIILYIFFKRVNDINDYIEYEVTFNKKINEYKWKEFYKSFKGSMKDSLRQSKLRLMVSKVPYIFTKIFKAYDKRFLIQRLIGNPQSYIDIIEKVGDNSKMLIKVSDSWYGDKIKDSIISAINHEVEIGHIDLINIKETDYLYQSIISFKFKREKIKKELEIGDFQEILRGWWKDKKNIDNPLLDMYNVGRVFEVENKPTIKIIRTQEGANLKKILFLAINTKTKEVIGVSEGNDLEKFKEKLPP